MRNLNRWLHDQKTTVPAMTIAAGSLAIGIAAMAAVLDNFGPPPPGDPSEFTGPLIGEEEAIDDIDNLPDANLGAFEGGATGTAEDPGENGSISENQLEDRRDFDVPTGAPPSPLFGAGEFEQQMLRFEEFGLQRLATAGGLSSPFPRPSLGAAPTQDP